MSLLRIHLEALRWIHSSLSDKYCWWGFQAGHAYSIIGRTIDIYPIFIASGRLPKVHLSKPKTRFAFAATDRTWDFHERSHALYVSMFGLSPCDPDSKANSQGRNGNRNHCIGKDGKCTCKLNTAHWVQEKPFFCTVCFYTKILCMPSLRVLLDSVVRVKYAKKKYG